MPKSSAPPVTVDAAAVHAIHSFFDALGRRCTLRIDLHSTGCCDPSVGLSVDSADETDLVHHVEDLTFVIAPQIHQLIGDVHIAHVDEIDRKGFSISSSKSLSEWDGFGVTEIRCDRHPGRDGERTP